MQINKGYLVVTKVEDKQEGSFETIQIQDSSTYKGKVKQSPNDDYKVGDIVLFAKYSPDTHDFDLEGERVKFVKLTDILAIL